MIETVIASATRASGTVGETVQSVMAGSAVSVTDRHLQESLKKYQLLKDVLMWHVMRKSE